MMSQFGGAWTVEKLGILSSYLDFYVKALKNQHFKLIYIDAFAGTGKIQIKGSEDQIIEGSARLALKVENKFDQYIFIEKKRESCDELKQMVDKQYPYLFDKITIYRDDCNSKIKELCNQINWKNSRAILFLDPYATELKWETLEIIAKTKAIDLWYLFPLSAANRMLKKNGEIDSTWKACLDVIFGDEGWYDRFYCLNPQQNLFYNNDTYIKNVDTNCLSEYICERLKTIFPAVASNPRILYNSKHSPLFLFCFAVSNNNPAAKKLALKVANYILNH